MSSDRNDIPTPARRPLGIWLIVAAAMLITALCATVVWYGFVMTPETNCTIVVSGDKDLNGTTVEVLPKVAADPDRALLSVPLSENNQYSACFFLISGTYTVRAQRDGSTVMDITDFVAPGQRWSYTLPHPSPGAGEPAEVSSTTQPVPSR